MTTVTRYPGAVITAGPQSWEVLQREADGCAPLMLEGVWSAEESCVVEVRVACEDDGMPAGGCDWQDALMLADNRWQITLRVPTGGLYSIETRLRQGSNPWRLAGDKIWHVAVGDLWVIAGQSNAVGYGHGPVSDPPCFGVSLFGGNELWRLATHPIFDSTGTKYPANRDSGWVDVSPWLAFGKIIRQQAGVPVGLIPTALGGSPLSAWDPGNPDGPYLYNNMLNMIAAAGGKVAGMAWYQGCSDAYEPACSTYLERFACMVADFRARYGADLPVITVQLNRHLDAAPEGDHGWSMLREAQRQAARTLPRVAVVPALDLSLSDGIHTSAVGNVTLGQRCGLAALGMAYGKPVPWQPVDLHNARFLDETREKILLSFDHVVDHLVFLAMRPDDFQVVDAEGAVPQTGAYVDGTSHVMLQLARPAQGETVVHHLPGGNPPQPTLRDHLQRPVLAFYQAPVEG